MFPRMLGEIDESYGLFSQLYAGFFYCLSVAYVSYDCPVVVRVR